jgi:hypothetical protein
LTSTRRYRNFAMGTRKPAKRSVKSSGDNGAPL